MAESSEEARHLEFAGEFDCLPEPLPTLRHSTSHVMAQAVKRLFPEVKVAIGPAIEDGFYYDFLKATPFTPEDLERIEQVMREIVKADYPFTREEMPREKAIAFFEERGEPFKVEILRGHRRADGLDLPAGRFPRPLPRARTSRRPASSRPSSCSRASGAYWRGDEKNPMLQRIYGTAWLTQEELDKHVWRLEEAKKRDHRKLGRELDLFDFFDIAPGAPFWLPGGMVLVRELEKFARESLDARGYQEIATPLLVNKKLWEQSGHWDLYQDNMFKFEVEDEVFSLKPMNCPESALRLQAGAPLLPGPPHPLLGDGARPPQRALRRAVRAGAGAPVHPGRRAPLLPAGTGPVRDHGSPPAGARVVRHLQPAALVPARHAASRQARDRAAVGPGGGRAPPGSARERPRLRSGQGRRRGG